MNIMVFTNDSIPCRVHLKAWDSLRAVSDTFSVSTGGAGHHRDSHPSTIVIVALWDGLLNEEVSVGEFRVQEHRANWVLHVTVEYPIEEPEEPDNPTPVDFDIGESKLLVGCAFQQDVPTQPFLFDFALAFLTNLPTNFVW